MRALAVMILLAMLALSGCAAHRAYREGQALQATGDVAAASARYLDALDRRPHYVDAEVALRGVAQKGWDARYARAAKAEEAMDFTTALAQYRALRAYEGRLQRHDVTFTPKVDTRDKIEAMSHGAAQRAYMLAGQARQQGKFQEAITQYRAALKFVPHFEDAETLLGQTWLDWGAADQSAGRWRDAVSHYDQAGSAGQSQGHVLAAEILAALGRYHLRRGACRQAVKDLQGADDRVAGSVEADLAQAQACATVRVTVAIGASRGPGGYHHDRRHDVSDGQARMQELMMEQLGPAAGPFVQVVSPMVLQGPPTLPNGRFVVDRVVYGAMVHSELHRPEPQTREAHATVEVDRACKDDNGEPKTCTSDLDAVYDLVHQEAGAGLSTSLQVIQVRDGAVLGAQTFQGRAHAEVWWARDIRDARTGEPLRPGHTWTAVHLPSDLQDLVDAPHDLPPPDVLFQQAADQVAAQAVPWAASLLLPPEDDADPTTLDVRQFPTVMHRPR